MINLRSSLRWLSRKSDRKRVTHHTKFIVCIPVLNEQSVIKDTLDKFLAQNYPASCLTIYVVTTAKERRRTGQPSTEEVVRLYQKQLTHTQRAQLKLLNYPNKNGRMAHQINFLASRLKNVLSEPDTYFVIYNADSNILPDTFAKVNREIISITNRTGISPGLLQQSAVYQYASHRGFMSKAAEGAGLHQTLWTLMHEIPKLRKQSSGLEKLGKSQNYFEILAHSHIAHCVGHGLFVHGAYYLRHPLPDGILNEDLPYGLLACALRESIYPIPSLELASTPSRLRSVYQQKSVWFNPFFEFYDYAKSLIDTGRYYSKFELRYLVAQAYLPLFIWLTHSLVLLGGLVAGCIAGWPYVAIWAISLCLYWFIPALIITEYRKKLQNGGSNSVVSVSLGTLYALTHSVGPIWSTMRWTRARILKITPDKPKTGTA